MTSDPVAVLSAIVAEVAGAGQPFSADSYLPPHLIHDARDAIESAVPVSAKDAHVELLLARIRKADETMAVQWSEIDRLRLSVDELDRRIVELQREVESEREACRKSEKRISALHDANAELEKSLESANSENRAICRRCDGLVKLNDELSSALSKRIPGFPPETLPDTSHLIFDPFQRLTAYGRRQECDE